MVSICVITYNHEKLIEECLRSILNQKTMYPFEVIIGEDGSTDRTREIIENLVLEYPQKITLLPFQGNVGMMPNFMRTLKHCKGRYLAICEGDDYWSDPHKIQQQVDFLEKNPDYSICFTNTAYYNQRTGDRKEIITSTLRTRNIRDLIRKNFIATQTVMYRNRDLKLPFGFENLKVGDWPLHVLYAQYGKLGHLDKVTAVYRIHDNNSWNGEASVKKVLHMAEAALFLSRNIQPEYKMLVSQQALKWIHYLVDYYSKAGNYKMAKKIMAMAKQLPNWWLSWKVYYMFLKTLKR